MAKCNIMIEQSSMRKRGFTLLEMSVVLVIIGLIVGGVIAGRELYESAQIRKLMSTVEKLSIGINLFKNKYSNLPGDIANANVFLSSAPACPASPSCNGNGDGQVTMQVRLQQGYWHSEASHFFPQLYQAGFIEKKSVHPGLAANPEVNEDFAQNGYYPISWFRGPSSGTPTISFFSGITCLWGHDCGGRNLRSNAFYLSGGHGPLSPGGITYQTLLAIDQKHDDGTISTGKVMGWNRQTDSPLFCTSVVGDAGIRCQLIVKYD